MSNFFTNPSDIESWLEQRRILCYHILDDMSVDVDDHVDLNACSLTHIPVQFNRVKGDFGCATNSLTSLLGSPWQVEGFFDCSNNQLTSLQHVPQLITESFYCNRNQITSLLGAPQIVFGSFKCAYNSLTSLEHCPKTVEGMMDCSFNSIKNLAFCPDFVCKRMILNGNFDLGAAQEIDDFFEIKKIQQQHLNITNENKLLHEALSSAHYVPIMATKKQQHFKL